MSVVAAVPRRRASLLGLALGISAALLVVAVLLSLGVGAMGVHPVDVMRALASRLPGVPVLVDHTVDVVIWQIRVPRTLLGLVVGAALATAGAMFQGLFRNPLADPGLLGVTLGAAAAVGIAVISVGAVGWAVGDLSELAVPWLSALRPYLIPIAAFVGALISMVAVVALSGGLRQLDVATLLLGGIAINAIAGAITGLCVFLADDAQLRDLSFWSLGGLGGATWPVVAATVPPIVAALAAVPLLARRLDCLQLGEAEAAHLGVPVVATKRWIVGIGALLVGVSVAAAGAIGFVGLIVPHLVRLTLGPGHRLLLPISALFGAALLVFADVLARTVVAPAELPIGVLTTLLGGPFFLALLLADRRRRMA